MRRIPKRPQEPNRISECKLKKPLTLQKSVGFRFAIYINDLEMFADIRPSYANSTRRKTTIHTVYVFYCQNDPSKFYVCYDEDDKPFVLKERIKDPIATPLFSIVTKQPFVPTEHKITGFV